MQRLRNVPVLVLLMAIGALLMYLPALHALGARNHHVARAFFYSGTLFLIVVALIAFSTAANRQDDSPRAQLLTLLGAFTVLPLMLALPRGPALLGAVLVGLPSIIAVIIGVHWLGALVAVILFALWCGRLEPRGEPVGLL